MKNLEWNKCISEENLNTKKSFMQAKKKVLSNIGLSGVINITNSEGLIKFVKLIEAVYDSPNNESLLPSELENVFWINFNSEEKLRSEFKFNQIKKTVLRDINLENSVTINGYKNLLIFIRILRGEYEEEDPYFKSKLHRSAFMLTHYNSSFDKELGISRLHYVDIDTAKQWRNKYIKMFHPDNSTFLDINNEISSSINKLYKRMVGDSK